MKKIIYVLMVLFTSISFSACTETAEDKQEQATMQLTDEANRQVGMPNITSFQERKLAKLVMELRDRSDLICYAYLKSDMTGKLTYLGKCIGYGLPYGVSFTNPERQLMSGGTLPQAEPNGLYTNGITTSATWLFMIDPNNPKGDPKPVYIEPEIVVSPFQLKVD